MSVLPGFAKANQLLCALVANSLRELAVRSAICARFSQRGPHQTTSSIARGQPRRTAEHGSIVGEATLVTPLLFGVIFSFAYLSEVTLDYMSMSALAHESSEISSQTREPTPSPAFMMASSLTDEAGYVTCLNEITGTSPSEFCLTAVARWRSERLLTSLRLDQFIDDLNVETNYQPTGGDVLRPQLEIKISGIASHLPLGIAPWNLSARVVAGLRESGGAALE